MKQPEEHECFSSLHRTLGVDTWCDTDAITLLCQSSVAVAASMPHGFRERLSGA